MRICRLKLIWVISTLMILWGASSQAKQIIKPPIPASEQIVVWMRVSQVSQDRYLSGLLLQNNVVSDYLKLLKLDPSKIERLTFMMPFDKDWFNGQQGGYIPSALPKNGAFVIAGDFDLKAEFRNIKSKGWKEQSYSNKKVLWWSTGTNYYRNPRSGQCLGQISGEGLVVAGSVECMRNILDVAGGKLPGLPDNSAYDLIYQDFTSDSSRLGSMFIQVTPDMRALIKDEAAAAKSLAARTAFSYVDNLNESGLSIARRGDGFLLYGYLGIDTENNSMIAAGILQLGGGLASLFPPDDPNRNVLENLDISRQGKLVILQTDITGPRLLSLLGRSK
jgi:hypothetical protein